MSFKKETEAFDRLMANMDKAFQAGAFGLRDAMQVVPDVQTIASLLSTPEPELIRRFIAQPVDEWTGEPTLTEEQIMVPGTEDKVAKKIS